MSKSRSKSCPSGQIWRNSYSRKQNNRLIKVKGKCIRSVSQSKQKRSVQDQAYIKSREKIQKRARRKFSRQASKRCPSGQIMREGYYRKPTRRKSFVKRSGTKVPASRVKGAWVPPVCVDSINPVKKKRLFVLEKGVLGKYGYHGVANLSKEERHDALEQALEDIEPLPLFRRVNALFVLNKNTNPGLAKKYRDDAAWIKTTRKYLNRPTARPSRSMNRSRKSRKSTKSQKSRKSRKSRKTGMSKRSKRLKRYTD